MFIMSKLRFVRCGDGDVIFGLLIGLFFGFLNSFEDKQLPCPSYCGVDHIHAKIPMLELYQDEPCDTLYYCHHNNLPHISQR